jgi:hypothetical protein
MSQGYILAGNKVVVQNGGRVITANATNDIVAALARGDYQTALSLMDTGSAIQRQSEGEFIVESGSVFYQGKQIHNVITDRILEFYDKGLPFGALTAFLKNLLSNQSHRAITELYAFLEHRFLPITEDGCFLAYKGVQNDYFSITAGKLTLLHGRANARGQIYNGIGERIACPRNEVDDEKDRTCSNGLHVGALNYAKSFGSSGRVVVVKVNPRDAVSVPSDHNAEKLRVCDYTVIANFESALTEPLVTVGGGSPSAETRPNWWRQRGAGGRFVSNK